MKRRTFLKFGSAAAATIAAPAVAQSNPNLKWRLTSSFPRSLDSIYGASEVFSKAVSDMTDGQFSIQVFAAGEIVGGLQAADAVSAGTVEMAHTASYYYIGKDPTFAVATGLPFGLNARQQTAWLTEGGGSELLQPFFSKQNIHALLAGNIGAQMGGWFRREINTTDDLRGLKFRIGGLGGRVLAKLGVVPQQIAAGDIYTALERGTIDAAEWIGPYDDEKLGFVKVAKNYYYPAWWEGGAAIHNFVNLNHWGNLPKRYQEILANASATANQWMLARYDTRNAAALRRLVGSGAQLRPFSAEIMEASFKAANELYSEIGRENEQFRAIAEAYFAFRDESYLWHQVADMTYDQYMVRFRRR